MADYPTHALEIVSNDTGLATQLPIFDLTAPTKPAGQRHKKQKVAETLATIRHLADELNQQLYTSRRADLPKVRSQVDAAEFFIPLLSSLEHEELWVMCLNVRNGITSIAKLYQGSVNQTQIRVGEIFRHAISDNAVNIIIAHNHPTGDPTPSPDDVAMTRAVVQAGKLLDITLLDHIIVAGNSFLSLKERGLGFGS